MKKIITIIILAIVAGLIISSIVCNFPMDKSIIFIAATGIAFFIIYGALAVLGLYLIHLLIKYAIKPLFRKIAGFFKGVFSRQPKAPPLAAIPIINAPGNSNKKFPWRKIGIASLLIVLAIGTGYGIYSIASHSDNRNAISNHGSVSTQLQNNSGGLSSNNNTSSGKFSPVGGQEWKMSSVSSGETKMGVNDQQGEKMTKVQNKPTAIVMPVVAKKEPIIDTMVTRVHVSNNVNESNNTTIQRHGQQYVTEKPIVKEIIVEEDSIVREAVLGEWSDWAFLKNSPKDPGALKIRIKSTGPVRVERDRICNVYREPETSDIIHGNEIGGYVSNWCVRFTSLSENTERVVIYFPKKKVG